MRPAWMSIPSFTLSRSKRLNIATVSYWWHLQEFKLKKWSYPSRISSVNVTKSEVSHEFTVDLITFAEEILTGKLYFWTRGMNRKSSINSFLSVLPSEPSVTWNPPISFFLNLAQWQLKLKTNNGKNRISNSVFAQIWAKWAKNGVLCIEKFWSQFLLEVI